MQVEKECAQSLAIKKFFSCLEKSKDLVSCYISSFKISSEQSVPVTYLHNLKLDNIKFFCHILNGTH